MDARLHFLSQNAINLLVTRHFTLAFKGVADDHHFEVTLRSGRHGVHIALIHYIQMLHRQTLGQLLLDTFFHGHLNDSLAWLGRVTDSPETSKAFSALYIYLPACAAFRENIVVQKVTLSHRYLHW